MTCFIYDSLLARSPGFSDNYRLETWILDGHRNVMDMVHGFLFGLHNESQHAVCSSTYEDIYGA